MKPHRVTIKYKNGEQTCVISTTVPAYNESQAIEKIITANGLAGKVIRKRAEIINPFKINIMKHFLPVIKGAAIIGLIYLIAYICQ